ncbi:hypothetical protein DYB28_012043 [Aphanomyces astaci]|uniref:Uncharacterized protein n=2 Tax=Aphanomyces astaci TaxID=112090 RepID=A0A9X8DVS9_APHAT|nr:hypothetical protein DYB28_012043 [Aphanomyces astaci]
MLLRYGSKTRYQYEKSLLCLKAWLQREHPGSLSGGEVVPPLDPAICKGFLAYECVKRGPDGAELDPQQFKSYSAVNGCKSAIKFMYKQANLRVSEELDALLAAEMSTYGVLVKDIGTHSFRKGVASELSNTPGGPEAVNVWLRAGWTLGTVQGRAQR